MRTATSTLGSCCLSGGLYVNNMKTEKAPITKPIAAPSPMSFAFFERFACELAMRPPYFLVNLSISLWLHI